MNNKPKIFIIGVCIVILISFVFLNKKSNIKNDCKFAVMGIFKNEGMGIKEWIEHYLWQGADLIVLLDNNSCDNYMEKIKHFDPNIVIVIPAKEKHAQDRHYSTIGLETLKKYNIDIVAVFDLDEYMFSKDGQPLKKTVIELFNKNKEASSIICNWTMFGSSGHVKQPTHIRRSFTWKKSGIHQLPKSIYLVDKIKDRIDIHSTNIYNTDIIDGNSRLQLNHYAIQSKEFFEKIKMTRGDAVYLNNVRTWKYFEEYDKVDEEDTLLIEHMDKTEK